ncbi:MULTISPECIES: tRNA (cytidine(34)-2'-O)-methyltransferase [Peptoniphilus]|uniref:Putative tRNA (cytidine(34)-2'-O)-methyltransferase n=1 Tax=Peptoniphilus duerdenii ATCC BAA-1640 TaxID=862517 RepID=E0NJ45_9FIRM|nr:MULTISPECIES: tRNA (cytidine(34)-2'-O)-methyltransferase [Peptoniphilus]EFM26164.1 putative RNA methyltransferase, TrmH family, group 2 [Peptoniphilus duerdenii ATCC BAA-1640]ERT63900.1 putative tRNA (cytidine(34)-2'-O)-methyltransferase [Peptoniphilus sp. BV3AC2]MDK8276379.1 tRNA (cytidine(34)-2'-O)-methyltransferase [Peptoniphilus duerdenii]
MSLNIVLYEPEIHWNTGAIARSCGLTHTRLHLIEPFGFEIDDKHLKRAGLDYWDLVDINIYKNVEELYAKYPEGRFFMATTKAKKLYTEVEFQDEDFIMFGPETRGLPEDMIFGNYDMAIKIPMLKDFGRSLNLANSANIILFEALRQLNFLDLG